MILTKWSKLTTQIIGQSGIKYLLVRFSKNSSHLCGIPDENAKSEPHQLEKLIHPKKRILFFFFFDLFRAVPTAYGSSQGRGPIGATADSPCRSHSNARSKPRVWHTPQPKATLDPQPTEQGQGIEPATSRFLVGFISAAPWRELQILQNFNTWWI